jgi:aspartyl-tRNA synthetase
MAIFEFKRTHYCGDLRKEDIGNRATVYGFVQRSRNLGGLLFTDLRDRTGLVQLAFDENTKPEVFEIANTLRSEFVVAASGIVKERFSKNSEIATGDVEIAVDTIKILSYADTPPFEIADGILTNEELRLKYRYLDLRRPELQNKILMRHKIVKTARDYYDSQGFIEIETPIMVKSTPEGARDYLVPSRVHPGKVYALPQSPQLYKQLLMVAGFDRYVQFARCFRDEDLRADRQPEFTQIDLEMSYVDVEDVLEVNEGFVKYLFKNVLDVDIKTPLKRLTYKEAMERYGSDKPDTRFGMELYCLNDEVKDCEFGVFTGALQNGGAVYGITVKDGVTKLTRKEIDKLTEYVRGIGGKGIAWIRLTEDGMTSSFAKFMKDDEMDAILKKADATTGDVVLIVADSKKSLVLSILGSLRVELAKKMELKLEGFDFLWITEFPFFEFDEDLGDYVAMHHPFTSPLEEDIKNLDNNKGEVRAKAYDLVLNGMEMASGSIRITDPDLQKKMFYSLGLSDEEAEEKFGFLTNAFKFGAPPHGGMGIGLDRLVLQMLGGDSLRDVIAFPKLKDASEAMTSCPSEVDKSQLDDLSMEFIKKADEKEED